VNETLTWQTVDLPRGPLRIAQPTESAELPDDAAIEWAPIAPYWSVLWRSGMALARELDEMDLAGKRVVELGCGLGLCSLVAARGGAAVTATDLDPDGLELVQLSAAENDLAIERAVIDWARPEPLLLRAPWDLVIASDVVYEKASAPLLLELLPRLAPRAILADPGRPPSVDFLAEARSRWPVETETIGIANIHRMDFARKPVA
jgi:predicted nicotinamide N-methyase